VISRINYDVDIAKHFVRLNGWLPAAGYRASRVGANRDPKYLTFCAANAIDVFLLEQEGHVKRDPKTSRLNSVYFCERTPDDFGTISSLIGSGHQGFLGDFAEIVLFEDTQATVGRNLGESGEYGRDTNLRHQLRIKEVNKRLKGSFPFDILNLDISGSLFPPQEPPTSRMIQAIRKVLDWQTLASFQDPAFQEFTIFITSRAADEETSEDVILELQNVIDANLSSYSQYRDEFEKKYQLKSAEALKAASYPEFFVAGLCKLLLSEVMWRSWDMEYRAVFLYQRPREDLPAYYIVSVVAHVKRFRQNPVKLAPYDGVLPAVMLGRYVEEATETLQQAPWIIDLGKLEEKELAQVKEHLASIVEYREKFKRELLK